MSLLAAKYESHSEAIGKLDINFCQYSCQQYSLQYEHHTGHVWRTWTPVDVGQHFMWRSLSSLPPQRVINGLPLAYREIYKYPLLSNAHVKKRNWLLLSSHFTLPEEASVTRQSLPNTSRELQLDLWHAYRVFAFRRTALAYSAILLR
jgi:hypothetical protein